MTLVINEIMVDPDAVGDTSGEWFELHNTGSTAIDLSGYVISDGVNNEQISLGGTVVIPAGGYMVFGNNADTATNGGVTVDYVYSSISLSNSRWSGQTAKQAKR